MDTYAEYFDYIKTIAKTPPKDMFVRLEDNANLFTQVQEDGSFFVDVSYTNKNGIKVTITIDTYNDVVVTYLAYDNFACVAHEFDIDGVLGLSSEEIDELTPDQFKEKCLASDPQKLYSECPFID